ncbi:MAG TPA: S-adenosylmethionine:tRNA ribosyltransferase-isomerase, partial [Clostridia bacterium]|nr:S-adenosylmethionine:tRNA ribosyltransferase-isomerase [Clostridia bacterium]
HIMHSEYYRIDRSAAESINAAKREGRKVIAVGTTSLRVLEGASDDFGVLHESEGETDIFIYPGYRFKVVDYLITNFHLPESTLIMLVSAMAGRENILSAYREAIKEKYRFFSFGDAMFITDSDTIRREKKNE